MISNTYPGRACFTKNLFYTFIACFLLSNLLPSCVTSKNSYYFQTLGKDSTINTSANKVAESQIKKSDLLSISISSLNRDEDVVYNAPAISPMSSTAGTVTANGYLVDGDGNIQLHKLGVIHVEGITRRELKDKIQTGLQPYLKDVVVTVRYLNHKITVLGEVTKPQVIQMPEEHLSILEVLGASGDVTPSAKRDNILIIRETATGKQTKRINLEDQSVFNSEWYWLQPDDVVYVGPNDKKIQEENRIKKQQTLSIALSALSVAVIVLFRFIK